jgi:hypothetical protein
MRVIYFQKLHTSENNYKYIKQFKIFWSFLYLNSNLISKLIFLLVDMLKFVY